MRMVARLTSVSARLRAAALVIVVSSIWACGADGQPTAPPPPPSPNTVELPVRVHVVTSRVAPIDATLTNSGVQALFDRANQVWQAAEIAWRIESISTVAAQSETEVELALANSTPLSPGLLLSVVAGAQLTPGEWDVFLVSDLTSAFGAPGVYFPSVPLMFSSQVDPAGVGDPGRILAHELGHSLTLPHVPCTPEGNLMSPGCPSADRTRLTAAQVQAARGQALRGVPVSATLLGASGELEAIP